MTRKLLMIGITLVGLTMAFGSNAWAENGRGSKDRRDDKAYHQPNKTPQGHHYGWEKGKGNPHRDGYQHHRGYDHRDRHPYRDRHHYRDRYHHRDRHYYRPVVEKHVYHHYRIHDRHDGYFNVAVSVVDDLFGVGVAVGGTR